jgi:hypothetical protein
VISWPAFTTSDNKPVAAGELSVVIGAGGTVSLALVPNQGADPAGTYYKVIYKLNDGTTATEYWTVPATSPTTIAAVRATVVPRQVAAQFVTREYVDEKTSNLNAGMAQKLSRDLDTPINFGALRFATEFAIGQAAGLKIDAACADLAGNKGTVLVPSTMAAGNSIVGTPSNCQIWDFRQNGGPSPLGLEGAGILRANVFKSRVTSVPDHATAYNSVGHLFYQDFASGGYNTVPKTTSYALGVFKLARSPGQHFGAVLTGNHTSFGDGIGLITDQRCFGGFSAGGDEGCIGLRTSVGQGNTIFKGTVFSKNGNTIVYDWTQWDGARGENLPMIITAPLVATQSAGTVTVASGPPVVVTGSGGQTWMDLCPAGSGPCSFGGDTTYTAQYAKFRRFFCKDADSGTGEGAEVRFCVPILRIDSNTQLTLDFRNIPSPNPGGVQIAWTGSTAAGTYKIFKGSFVTTVGYTDPAGQTGTFTVEDGTDFSASQSIENQVGASYQGTGISVIASTWTPTAASNTTLITAQNEGSRRISGAFGVGGEFDRLFQVFYDGENRPSYGMLLGAKSPNVWISGPDTVNDSIHTLVQVRRNAGSFANLTFNKATDDWTFANTLHISAAGNRMAMAADSQPGTAFYMAANGTDAGLVIQGNATGSLLTAAIGGVPRFLVNSTQAQFNNGIGLFGYSGDSAGQVWGVSGSNGRANFNGGVCYDNAQTVCDTVGSGAPAGACVTGSTYKRSNGGSASTLYICEAGAWSATGGAGSGTWNSIQNPSGVQSLSMGANASTWTWNAATGASVDLFRLTDSASNTGTGHILSVETASSSNAKPIQIRPRGTTAFEINELGVVTALSAVTTSSALSMQVGGQLTIKGRDDWAAPVAINGADFSGTSGVTAKDTSIRGGDATGATGSNVAGNMTVRSGGATSSSGTPGNLQIAQTFLKDTNVTSGFLQCFKAAAAMTVGDCGNSALNSVGVAISASNTNPVVVQFAGIAVLQFDSTVSPSAGWYACSSATAGGKVAVQSGVCAAGRQVGIVAQNGTSITSGKVFMHSR